PHSAAREKTPEHRVGIVGELVRAQQVGGGGVKVPSIEVRVAPSAEGSAKFRTEPDCLVVVGDGAVVLALVVVTKATVVEGYSVAGIEPGGLGVVGDGAVVLAFFSVCKATVFEG